MPKFEQSAALLCSALLCSEFISIAYFGINITRFLLEFCVVSNKTGEFLCVPVFSECISVIDNAFFNVEPQIAGNFITHV